MSEWFSNDFKMFEEQWNVSSQGQKLLHVIFIAIPLEPRRVLDT